MKEETKEINLNGKKVKISLLWIEERDRTRLRRLYQYWIILNKGMKLFKSRGINLPEGISESAFCLCYNNSCARALKVFGESGSFDVFDVKTKRRIQIKAVSVEDDLTSFGPKSVWDDLFFLDFYKDGKFDGSFNIYKIPNHLIYNHKVNANQTLRQQQAQGRRPRFSIKAVILKNKLRPIKTGKI